MFKKAAMVVLATTFVVLVAGCSKAPVTDETVALQEMTTAKELQADTYVPELWARVLDTLEAAKAAKVLQDERFALFRNFDDAQALYQRAATLAKQAGTQAQDEVKRIREEVLSMLDEAQTEANTLSEILVTFPVTKDTKADIEMLRQDTGVLQSLVTEARTEFDRGNYDSARSKIEAVLNRIAEHKQTMDLARSRVKGRSKV